MEDLGIRAGPLGRIRQDSWLARLLVVAAATGMLQCATITTIVVNTPLDLADDNPGDGTCQTVAGNCSLRAAIQEANAQGGRQEIQLPEGFYLLGIDGTGEDQAETGDLDVTDDLAIRGLGDAAHTVIDAQGIDRVFQVHPGAHLVLEDVMVQGGYADSDTQTGAGIRVADGGKLNLYRAVVNGNRAVGNGGGIYSLGQVVVLRSTISHNHTDGDGGGIYNENTLALSMSTVSTNDADGDGGGLGQSSSATTIIGNATFNLNTANDGGAIDPSQGSVSMVNTILANSPSGGNCVSTPIDSGGHNLSSDGSCELLGPNDVANTDPLLSGLRDFAGKGLPVHVLLENSPAIDAGDSADVDVARGDQLEVARTQIQIGAVGDLGAVLGVKGRLYVPSIFTGGPGGEVRIFDTVAHTLVGTMPIGDVRAAEVHPYGNLLFLARGRWNDNSVPDELRAYSLPALSLLWTVPLPETPTAVAASASSLKVYVVGSDFSLNTGYVTAINTGTAVSSSLTGLDLAPSFVDADLGSTSSLLFITGDGSGAGSEEIRIYSTATETLFPSALIPTGNSAVAIAPGVSPSRMYVHRFSTEVVMFPGWFPGTSSLGSLPKTVGAGDITVHPDGNRVYAGDLSSVDVIDVNAGSVTTTISAGGNSLAVHPSGYYVYGGEAFSSVDVIRTSTNSVTTTLSVPSGQSVSKMAVAP